jgi:hypothetical protein
MQLRPLISKPNLDHQIITSYSVRDRICHALCSPPAIGVAVPVCDGFGACVLRSSYPARNAAKRLSGDLFEWFEAAIHMPLYLLYSWITFGVSPAGFCI